MGHLNYGNILFMFHHIHGTFKFREFGAAASNMSLKNESFLRLISVESSMENLRSSLGNPRESDVFSLSSAEHLRRIAQSCIRISSPALRR